MQDYISSFSFDKRLAPYDIEGSIAHVQMLASKKIIPSKDAGKIIKGLKSIAKDMAKGKKLPAAEDIHFAIEAELVRRIGEVGKKMHTARSRNDQVVLDLKLYTRDAAQKIVAKILEVQKAILSTAMKNQNVLMPGYTHLQHGQPLFFAHHILAYGWMLERDKARFLDMQKRLNENPLGACAFAGTAFPIDRAKTAKALKFSKSTENSVDTVSDRDFIVEFVFASALTMTHLSRFAEEIVTWSSSEFGFISLPENLTSGSSIMPQKRNPDTAELIRGKSSKTIGNLTQLLSLIKNLPLSYNRDLQEDKPPLFESYDTTLTSLEIARQTFSGLKVNAARMEEECRKGFLLATELADYLARKGMAFRAAHAIVGKIVKDLRAESGSEDLEDVALDRLKSYSPLFKDDVYPHLSPQRNASAKNSYGGTGTKALDIQIRNFKKLVQ
ncbi:MAG: argininosuccinate lyase [Elusimicrobia bacterium RIFCSPLOWO2_01_FULL_54_10]|nr:MAG: argininosuccinate lyase [Elusimicrobia bacterium RIFCSPLOWO2_01_FULL_54_10]